MKTEFTALTFAIVVLIFGGAAEELSPNFLGVGLPFLFSVVIWFAMRTTYLATFVFALAAGTMEDALAGLPFVMSTSYFVLSAATMRIFRLPVVIAPLLYLGYQFWLWLWVADLNGSLFTRSLVALPVGAVVAFIVSEALDYIVHEGGVYEK